MHKLTKLLHNSDAWADEERTDVVVRKYLTERAEWAKKIVEDDFDIIRETLELSEPEQKSIYPCCNQYQEECPIHGKPKPKVKLEKWTQAHLKAANEQGDGTFDLMMKDNELIDAVQELREEKA